MHQDLIAQMQIEGYLQSVLNIPSHIPIKDARVNLDTVVPSTNTQSIMLVANQCLVLSSARNELTSTNDKIIESRDFNGESDSDFSIE